MSQRIAFATGAGFSEAWCGVSESVFQMVRALAEPPLVLTTGPHGLYKHLSDAGLPVVNVGCPVTCLNRLRTAPPRMAFEAYLAALVYMWRIFRELGRHDIDCVYLSDSVPILLASLPARFAGARIVLGLRGTPGRSVLWQLSYAVSWRIVALSAEMAAAIVAATHPWLRAQVARRIVIIHNGIALDDFRPDPLVRDRIRTGIGATSEDVVAVHVAHFDANKNQQWLVEHVLHKAFNDAGRRGRRLVVVFVGGAKMPEDVPYRAHCQAAAARFRSSVHFAGTQDDVWPWYAAADICLLASREEGQPRSVLEAMAAGIPVISTDVLSVAEMLNPPNAGFVIPRHDADAFANALVGLVVDGELRRTMGRHARTRCEESFDARRTASAYRDLFSAA